jgi:SAM-dependent methyltransferase
VSPIQRLPFKPASFDVVIGFEVLEHLETRDVAASLQRIRWVLRPGGHLCVSVPTWPIARMEWLLRGVRWKCIPHLANIQRWDSPHHARYRPGELESVLVDQGFEHLWTKRWFGSFSAVASYGLNPILRRLGRRSLDLHHLDAYIPFEDFSNQVILARRPASAPISTI